MTPLKLFIWTNGYCIEKKSSVTNTWPYFLKLIITYSRTYSELSSVFFAKLFSFIINIELVILLHYKL